jgi:RNA polymerase sigma factor (sigma-70 family)
VRDDELVTAALAGDPAAFSVLVDRNRARVESVVSRMVGQDAEDLVQEALLRAYLGLSQLRDPARFGAWLCGIAVNLAKMRLRRRARETSLLAEPVSDGALEDRELLQLVRDAIGVLPPGQRDAVLMYYVDGLSCDEIASLVGSSPGAVRARLHRARQQLRAELASLAPTATSKEEIHMIEMRVKDVIVRVAEDDPKKLVADHRIVVLGDEDGGRLLPIWVGSPEGNALALRLAGETTPRPMTSDLLVEVLRVTGARVERVVVTSLRERTFYAAIAVAVDGGVEDIDARPSDALNLAVRVGAPIFVEDAVLEQAAVAASDLATRLEGEAEKTGFELPPGAWHSLSAEMLQSLYTWPPSAPPSP